MQDIFQFAAAVVIISASGVMAPGPLFAATISRGIKEGRMAGLKMAYGHTLVELPLVLLIGIGALSLEVFPEFRAITSILGAASIFVFAALQIRAGLRPKQDAKQSKYGSFLTGVLLTGLNPFFLAWWFTIGFKLIADAYVMWSFLGILIMFCLHIWMDYAWLITVSALSSRGRRFLSNRIFKVVIVGINLALVYFGVSFVFDYLTAVGQFQS